MGKISRLGSNPRHRAYESLVARSPSFELPRRDAEQAEALTITTVGDHNLCEHPALLQPLNLDVPGGFAVVVQNACQRYGFQGKVILCEVLKATALPQVE